MRIVARRPWTCPLAVALALAAPFAASAAPRAEIVEAVVDVGAVARGSDIEHVFEIRNTGDEPLALTDVKPTCGCTVADYDRMIAPGQSGRIRAVVHTERFRGPIAKSVRVFTNDAASPEIELVVKADVRAIVEVDPGYARFLSVLGEAPEPAQQLLWSETPEELVVLGVESPYPFLDVAFREATEDERRSGRPGRQWIVEMRLTAAAPQGPLAEHVVVRTNQGRVPEIRIPVSGFVRPVVAVVPAVIDFGRREPAAGDETIVELTHLGSGRLTLGEITSSLPGVQATVEPLEDGKRYRLLVSLPPRMPKGPFAGKLTIATSSRVQPTLEIDLRGTIL